MAYSKTKDDILKELEEIRKVGNVNDAYKQVKKIRTSLAKEKTSMTQGLQDQKQAIINEYKDLISVSEPLELEYKEQIDSLKRKKEREARILLLPDKIKKLEEEGYEVIPDETILNFSEVEWVEYLTQQKEIKAMTVELKKVINNTSIKKTETNTEEIQDWKEALTNKWNDRDIEFIECNDEIIAVEVFDTYKLK